MRKYLLSMFILCFFVWGVVVDNVVVSSEDQLRQDVGSYTRYRVKRGQKWGNFDILSDELLIYAIVKNREEIYYMEHKSYFENALKNLPAGTPVQMRYVRRFPKFLKRNIYDLREGGIPIVRYSSTQLHQKQREVWKFTGIMGGIFLVLAVVGMIGHPPRS